MGMGMAIIFGIALGLILGQLQYGDAIKENKIKEIEKKNRLGLYEEGDKNEVRK